MRREGGEGRRGEGRRAFPLFLFYETTTVAHVQRPYEIVREKASLVTNQEGPLRGPPLLSSQVSIKCVSVMS